VPNDGDGGFNFDNNGGNYAVINNGNWDDVVDLGDSAWQAVFGSTPVPEPSTLSIIGAALIGFGAIRHRRRPRENLSIESRPRDRTPHLQPRRRRGLPVVTINAVEGGLIGLFYL
jgi:hypothetical protein